MAKGILQFLYKEEADESVIPFMQKYSRENVNITVHGRITYLYFYQ
jgi:hypothetical protein